MSRDAGYENGVLQVESVDGVTYEDEDDRVILRYWDDGELVEKVVDRV